MKHLLITEEELRLKMTEIGKSLYDDKLTYGTSGNISVRIPGTETCLIKPSGYSFKNLKPDDFILIDTNTRKNLKGSQLPSIETPFHTKLYQKRKDVGGVVHVHPKYSTIFSILKIKIIPMGVELFEAPALANGIGIARFALPGSDELAINLVNGIKDKVACLMPNHGITTLGKTIEEAAINARAVERLAELQFYVMLLGKPKPLPKYALKNLINLAMEKGLLV